MVARAMRPALVNFSTAQVVAMIAMAKPISTKL